MVSNGFLGETGDSVKRETWRLRLAAHRYGRKLKRSVSRGSSSDNSSASADQEPVATTTEKVINDNLVQHVVAVKMFSRTFPTSNVWVLHDGNEAALIDSGYGDKPSIDARREYFRKDWSGHNFKRIAMTHHHFDHSSGCLLYTSDAADE